MSKVFNLLWYKVLSTQRTSAVVTGYHGGRRRRFGFHVVFAWPATCLSWERSYIMAL